MKNFSLVIVLILSFNLFAQSDKNYFIDSNDKKIIVYQNTKGKSYEKYNHRFSSDYAITGQFFWYHNKDGDLIKAKQRKIKDAYLDGKHYSNLNIVNIFGSKRLHEIIVQNEKYVLTQYYFNGYFYCYLIDKLKGKYIFKKEKVSFKKSKDEKLFEKEIMPYFGNCKPFVTLCKRSMNETYRGSQYNPKNNMFKYVSNFSCE